MSDLKIPNLNKKSDKFFFKKKLSLRRKSKRKLINESFLMCFFSVFFICVAYTIPNKISILNNFSNNLRNLINSILVSLTYSYEVCLAIIIIMFYIFAFILMLGVFSRLMKILKRKSKQFKFK